MSKSAIATFFQHNREVTAMKKALLEKRIEMDEQQRIIDLEVDDTAFKQEVAEVDFLLKRNWFLDDNDINDLLWSVDEDVFKEILDRISSYQSNIQQILASFLPMNENIRSRIKLRIREVTDEEIAKREIADINLQKKQVKEAWDAHLKESNLQPPVGELDSEHDEMYAELQQAKKDLESVKKKSLTGRYVPPNMRNKMLETDPDVIKAEKVIQKLENELIRQKQRIEQEHNDWFFRKRCEFEQKMLAV